MRLCITGGPKTGKTTMASRLHESAEGTDTIVDAMRKGIETVLAEILSDLNRLGVVIEMEKA